MTPSISSLQLCQQHQLIYLTMLLHILLSLFFFTTCATATHTITSASHAIPFPTHEHFNVKKTLSQAINLHPPPKTQEEFKDESRNEGSWKLNLLHRDNLPSSNFTDFRRRFASRMKRDAHRVTSLIRKTGGSDSGTGFGVGVVSGSDLGSGEYFVRVGVGSPPQYQYMVIDTGSDIMWVQCQPCNQCYLQYDPVFDPSLSASFADMPCSSASCPKNNLGCNSGLCKYEVTYNDRSYTMGTMAFETLTFGLTVVQNVAIGCGHINQGLFIGADGLLGLGSGSMSIVGQLFMQTGGAFSYCLVSRGSDSFVGSLEFGRGPEGAFPVDAMWVPLLHSKLAPDFYYIGLSGLGVGRTQLPITEDVFRLTELGKGGVVLDTGTVVTRLPMVAYVALRDAFMAQTANLPRAPSVFIYDTCYDLNGLGPVVVPSVSFFLKGDLIWTLPARNFLVPVDERGTFCFAFAPSTTGLSIIGNIQQEGLQISIDSFNSLVGFGPNNC